jgi:serine/threonine-protein kinase HipA
MPFPEVNLERYLTIGVGKDGRWATVNNALSDVASFGLDRQEAFAIALSMQRTVKARWEILFKENRFTATEIERFRTCFIACDEPIGRENGEVL